MIQGNHNIFVINTGNNNLRYSITAHCSPVRPTTDDHSGMVAEKLYVVLNKVNSLSDVLYNGPLSDLVNWPPDGRFLPPLATEEFQLFLSLPVVTVDLPPNPAITVNITFASEQN